MKSWLETEKCEKRRDKEKKRANIDRVSISLLENLHDYYAERERGGLY